MKILVIGQAPPASVQVLPYDTTLFYDWLQELGISKQKAQELFEWEAVSDVFPGFAAGGGHKVPSQEDMDRHWKVLEEKIKNAQKVLVLGGVPKAYLATKEFFVRPSSKVVYLMHPSKRNYALYNKNKESVLKTLKSIL